MIVKPTGICLCCVQRCYRRKYSTHLNSFLNELSEPVNENNKYGVLEDVVTPLARIPYNRQLKMKETITKEFVKQLRTLNEAIPKNVNILPISPSPVTDHYRNKDEFNIYKGIDGDPKTFGFFTGKPGKGEIFAVRPTHLLNIKPAHKRVLEVFEDFVKKSPLPPCYRLDDGGYWRQLLIRSNRKGDIMAVSLVRSQDRPPDELQAEKEQLLQHFLDNDVQLQSLYHVMSPRVKPTPETSHISLIHGEPYIYEELLGYKFRISLDSFFQINVDAAEVLHQEINNMAGFKNYDTVLDICCGVGTYSISFHKNVRNCVGLDYSTNSIEDALANAAINNVPNCMFTIGKVEERLPNVLEATDNVTNLVAIANPSRAGLHERAVFMLRRNPAVSKLIYVSCDPCNRLTMNNFHKLTSTTLKRHGVPFRLKMIKPVDLFPHTYHFETILLFEK